MDEFRVSSHLQWEALTSFYLAHRISEDGRKIHLRVSKGKGEGVDRIRVERTVLDRFRCILCIRMAIALHSE